ncbi:MAG: DUF3667 domain-containing protein [Chitinophagales bacterium]
MNDSSLYKCPNCEKFYDKDFQYCPHCGQKHEENVFTLKELLSDFLGSLISFDSKAFNSLPKLIFRPGKLTVDYLKGKRASNLSPFRMYLFFSVVLFLLLPLIIQEDKLIKVNEEVTVRNAKKDLNNVFLTIQDSIEANFEEEDLQEVQGVPGMTFSLDDSTNLKNWKTAVNLIENGATIQTAVDSVFSDKGRLAKFTIKQALKVNAKKGIGLMGVFLNSLSYSLFLFLPLFALILKLLYVRRNRYYVEHVIFSLHLFSFLFFTLIILVLLRLLSLHIPLWIIGSLILLYLYFALKRAYLQGWLKTAVKNAVLLFTTVVFLCPVIIAVVLIISFIFY